MKKKIKYETDLFKINKKKLLWRFISFWWVLKRFDWTDFNASKIYYTIPSKNDMWNVVSLHIELEKKKQSQEN